MSSAPVEKRRGVESNMPVSRSKELRRTGARASASPRIDLPRRSGVECPLRLSIVMCLCMRVCPVEGDTLKVTPRYASKMWFVITLFKGRP